MRASLVIWKFTRQLCLNASWPYWQTLDNDAVHVQSPASYTAKRLQVDALHPVCQQSARGPPALWLLLQDCQLPQNGLTSSTISSTVQVACSAHNSVAQPAQVLRLLNNWSNRPNTACSLKYTTVILYVTWSTGAVSIAYLWKAYFVITFISL